MRRRPSASFAIGSCASTITTELTAQRIPISRSFTPTSFFANGGSSSTTTAIPPAMKSEFRAT